MFVDVVLAACRLAEQYRVRSGYYVLSSVVEEVGELSTEVAVAAGDSYKTVGADGVFGEVVDVLSAVVDLAFVHNKDICEADLLRLVVPKLDKWLSKVSGKPCTVFFDSLCMVSAGGDVCVEFLDCLKRVSGGAVAGDGAIGMITNYNRDEIRANLEIVLDTPIDVIVLNVCGSDPPVNIEKPTVDGVVLVENEKPYSPVRMLFSELALGFRFRYVIDGVARNRVWVKLSDYDDVSGKKVGLIAEYSAEYMKHKNWIGQHICCCEDTEELCAKVVVELVE